MINVGSFLYFIAYTIDYISFLTSSQTYLEENIPNSLKIGQINL